MSTPSETSRHRDTAAAGESAAIIPFLPRPALGRRGRRGRPACARTTPAAGADREARKRSWRAADACRSFWDALLDLGHCAYIAERDAEIAEAKQYVSLDDDRPAHMEAMRAATAAQLLTPAPTQAALNWKLAQAASDRLGYLPIDRAALARVIEADRAWLAANKRSTKRAGRGASS